LQDNEQVYMTTVSGYPLPPGHCLHVVKSIYGFVAAPLAFHNLCVDVLTKLDFSGFGRMSVFIKYEWNIQGKDSHLKARPADLDVLSSLVVVPEGNRVYPNCPHSIAMLMVISMSITEASASTVVS
jgi:hypothetical protein